jgi:hypothetical protein
MFTKYRMFRTCVFTLVILYSAAAVALAARQVDPVRNLRLVSGDVNKVKIAWDEPKHGSTPDATIDEYIIKRNGRRIADLQGFHGLVDTSYIDGSPSSKDADYSVVAVDSNGKRSPPESVHVKAPDGASSTPPPAGKDPEDGIQSSDLCSSIIPPDIRGHNQPTAMEKYGCGKGMNSVNDNGPKKVLGIGVSNPIHKLIQSFFIQLPTTLGQTFWLLISGLAIWVQQAGTYLGIANLFAGILQTFNGDPSWPALLSIGISVGVIVLAVRLIKEQHRQGYISVGIIVAALAILTLLLSSPYRWMKYAVEKPLSINAEISNSLTDMTSGADLGQQFNLTVHPTYSGKKSNAAIRKQENTDWLMFQYLPQCAVNFNDYRWALTHRYPDSRTTYCEKFLQTWGAGSDKDKDRFKDKLNNANKDVGKFFGGDDQMLRVVYTLIAKACLFFHHILKVVTRLAMYLCGLLLLFEVFAAAIWLIYAMFGTDSSRWVVERRIVSAAHYIKVPLFMTAWGLVELTGAANIASEVFDSGFLAISAALLLWEVLALFVAYSLLKKMHRERKEAMEARGAYREHSSHMGRKALEYGMVAATGAAGASKFAAARMARKKARGEEPDGFEGPADTSFVFRQGQPQLAAGPAGGYYQNGGDTEPNGWSGGTRDRGPNGPPGGVGQQRPFDIEGTAEDVTPRVAQFRALPSGGPANGSNRGDNGSSPTEPRGSTSPARFDRKDETSETAGRLGRTTDSDVPRQGSRSEGPVYDAEVVEDTKPDKGEGAFRPPRDNRF